MFLEVPSPLGYASGESQQVPYFMKDSHKVHRLRVVERIAFITILAVWWSNPIANAPGFTFVCMVFTASH